ncbi:type II toxin-antitoxin system HicA family toxin [Stutzerimonas stutzeri]|uniref:type II toxin-antitoxin system HicA family toxin n=1 Tax=Stutzerimonas stutzeri TaxID=316 RepID=UPI000F76A992|nr:type II toxin-antitoxin system HicA family toxin [Stutzerimonas stutzeri]RSH68252.1 type II toxin-antitoxin system HicA family toxin [Stutzerimonas stutzeri]
MSSTAEHSREDLRFLALIEFALREGWHVRRTLAGQLKLLKPGLPPIFTRSTVSDDQASQST